MWLHIHNIFMYKDCQRRSNLFSDMRRFIFTICPQNFIAAGQGGPEAPNGQGCEEPGPCGAPRTGKHSWQSCRSAQIAMSQHHALY